MVDDYLRANGMAALLEHTKCKATRHGRWPNLVLFKYGPDSPIEDQLTQQCRGIILDEADGWRVVCWPYSKFFNLGDPNAATIDWDSATVYEKLDGSLCSLYWYGDQWNVATSGSPDASGNVHGGSEIFSELFWATWQHLGYRFPANKTATFMFELMTRANRVVVAHKEPRLVLHGLRLMGYEFPPVQMCGWECVKRYSLRNARAVAAAARHMHGTEQEGFVVCDTHFNRIKVKSPSYVRLHHARSYLTPRRMLDLMAANEADEFTLYFPEYFDEFEALRGKVKALIVELEQFYFENEDIEVQRDFAYCVRDHRCSGAMFARRSGKVTSMREWVASLPSKKLLALL